MIDTLTVNEQSFNNIKLNDQLTFHDPFYVASYKNDISFISPIINIKNNIIINNELNDFLSALIVNYNVISSFMDSYNKFINSDFIKSQLITLLNIKFKSNYNFSFLDFKTEKIFLEDDTHICFNMYMKNCTSTEIMNTVCPEYMKNVFPNEYFITPYYEHKQTKFYIQKSETKEEIDYNTFIKVYNQYNNLQFIFGLSNINIQSKFNKFIASQHKYVKEIILMN